MPKISVWSWRICSVATKIQGLDGDVLTELFSAEEIYKRVTALGKELGKRFAGEKVIALCVLRGAVFFFSDLVRALPNLSLELDFIRLSSYGQSTKSGGHVAIEAWPSCRLEDKHVIIVEDIIDSGLSMQCLLGQLSASAARSVTLCALIDKSERRLCEIPIDYSCFSVEKGFLVGYGLDYADRYRHLPAVYELSVGSEQAL